MTLDCAAYPPVDVHDACYVDRQTHYLPKENSVRESIDFATERNNIGGWVRRGKDSKDAKQLVEFALHITTPPKGCLHGMACEVFPDVAAYCNAQ